MFFIFSASRGAMREFRRPRKPGPWLDTSHADYFKLPINAPPGELLEIEALTKSSNALPIAKGDSAPCILKRGSGCFAEAIAPGGPPSAMVPLTGLLRGESGRGLIRFCERSVADGAEELEGRELARVDERRMRPDKPPAPRRENHHITNSGPGGPLRPQGPQTSEVMFSFPR